MQKSIFRLNAEAVMHNFNFTLYPYTHVFINNNKNSKSIKVCVSATELRNTNECTLAKMQAQFAQLQNINTTEVQVKKAYKHEHVGIRFIVKKAS